MNAADIMQDLEIIDTSLLIGDLTQTSRLNGRK